jgi:ribosome maturation factor RimP
MGDELVQLLAPVVASTGLELVDVEVRNGLVRVTVDGPEGAGLDAIAEATRAVSAYLDEHDPLPSQRYTLEVSSPGVERPLRQPRHFQRAVGETVSVRTVGGGEGERRFTGRLAAADDEGFVLQGEGLGEDGRRFAYADIERARTVFEWGAPSPKAGRGRAARRGASGDRGTDREKVTTP